MKPRWYALQRWADTQRVSGVFGGWKSDALHIVWRGSFYVATTLAGWLEQLATKAEEERQKAVAARYYQLRRRRDWVAEMADPYW